jgi:hypothetical protein
MPDPATKPQSKSSLAAVPTPATAYSVIELLQPLVNTHPVDRKSQMVSTLRATGGVIFKEHPAGVEIAGNATWKGIVPWSNIKAVKR